MKIDFSACMTDFDGAPIVDVQDEQKIITDAVALLLRVGEKSLAEAVVQVVSRLPEKTEERLTLKKVCIRALGAGVQGEKNPEQMLKLFDFGNALRPGGEIDITPEDASMLKDLLAKAFKSPLVAGQAAKLLNG